MDQLDPIKHHLYKATANVQQIVFFLPQTHTFNTQIHNNYLYSDNFYDC